MSKRPLNTLKYSELTSGGYAARLLVQYSKPGVYDLMVDGYWVASFLARNRREAVKILRATFRNYQSSAWNQSLYFDGHLRPDEISYLGMSTALRHKIEGLTK